MSNCSWLWVADAFGLKLPIAMPTQHRRLPGKPPESVFAIPTSTEQKAFPMKKLKVTIELEMSVPDDWQLVATSEDSPVLQLPNGVFMDIAIEPLFATDPEETWSSTENEETLNDILDMVESEAVAYEFVTH